ncbi:hypothetical protein C0995_006447 [Termitomyces sp. Mi166|nr:hypothetical protein C0995_006447 [Termitomyces sp. Mi166\
MADLNGPEVLSKVPNLPPTALYGYVPSGTATLAFIILFAISTDLDSGTLRAGGIHEELVAHTDYLYLRICTTIMAPTFLLAANFVIFGRIIERLGTSYSRLPPTWYSILFITCDVIALIIQGTGGGLASAHIKTDPTPGGNVMLGGIAFQLAVIVIYTFLATEFFVRYMSNKPFRRSKSSKDSLPYPKPMTRKLIIMSLGIGFCTICLFIRSVYRLIELADGWLGRIIRTEVYFSALSSARSEPLASVTYRPFFSFLDVLDGVMITLAIYTFNFIHPGFFLADDDADDSEKARDSY